MRKPKCYSYIRFSTSEQLKGSSLKRQLGLAREYAHTNKLELDESLTLHDLGISAYKGKHRTEGALGEFLSLVNSKKIPKGSILIVESLDRLSREQVLDALNLFLNIIREGIKIVTLMDNMEYSEETINSNIGQLMFSLTIMSRAHEESLVKSKRLKAAWVQKRENIRNEVLTRVCPSWLKVTDDKKGFIKLKRDVRLFGRYTI